MSDSGENLKKTIEYLGLSKNDMARSIGVDPSLISRWLSGQRKLRATSPQIEDLAEYILAASKSVADVEWLNKQFEESGLISDGSDVYKTKQNLIIWLASDGEAIRRNLSSVQLSSKVQAGKRYSENPGNRPSVSLGGRSGDCAKIGNVEIALELRSVMENLPLGSSPDIFLSSDQIKTIVNPDIVSLILQAAEKNELKIRMVVCVSGSTESMSLLISTYMKALVSGHVSLYLVHGMAQTITNQMHLIFPGAAAVLITETQGSLAPPLASVITDEAFIKETGESFEATVRYAQPVLNIYGDEFSRNILEILYLEFAKEGNLDILKDNINPMYMAHEAYDEILYSQGFTSMEYAWRTNEFRRFTEGMDSIFEAGTVFREILPMKRLNRIAEEGFCKMPGLYFMNKGYIDVDAKGCGAIIAGYIKYLKTVPNFQVLILDDINMLHENNCWQLKQNRHVAINNWSGESPIMVYTDQLILVREFQQHFDRLWAMGEGSLGGRSLVIAILQDVLNRLTEKHLS